jgi:hypothetical protein
MSETQIVSTDDIPADLLDAYRAGIGPDAAAAGLLLDGGSSVAETRTFASRRTKPRTSSF